MFSRILKGFIDFLYPKTANVQTLETLSPTKLLEHLPSARDTDKLGEDIIAIFSYEDRLVRELIWKLKYRRNEELIESLAVILYDTLKTEISERTLFDSVKWNRKVLLIPMPMHAEKRRERGWNQTEILAKALMRLDTERLLTYSPRILEKWRHTESQTQTKEKLKREENVKESMRVVDKKNLEGACMIILDDVTTTGATFRDARRALRESGAERILCVALAH